MFLKESFAHFKHIKNLDKEDEDIVGMSDDDEDAGEAEPEWQELNELDWDYENDDDGEPKQYFLFILNANKNST